MSQNDHSINHQADGGKLSDEDLGLAGRTARFFIRSPLSPLFYLSMLLMGLRPRWPIWPSSPWSGS